MKEVLVSQNVTNTFNKFMMVKRILRGKYLMDFKGRLSALRKVGKKDVADTNLEANADARLAVYDLATALIGNNLADCLEKLAREVFLIQAIEKKRRYMHYYMSKLCSYRVREFANRLLEMNK